MSTKWKHLPNAKYIDAVIASANAYILVWDRVAKPGDTSVSENIRIAWSDTWKLAIAGGRELELDLVGDAVYRQVIYPAARNAVWEAVLALITWDDCAYMLESDPGELEILARLGDRKAILMLPACKVLKSIKEIENANV